MNMDNVEYWVLKSMDEARMSLQNGEVPVGSLFLIHKKILREIADSPSSEAKQIENNRSPVRTENIDVTTKNSTVDIKQNSTSDEMIVDSDTCESSGDEKREYTTPKADQVRLGVDNQADYISLGVNDHKKSQDLTEQNLESPNMTDKSGGYNKKQNSTGDEMIVDRDTFEPSGDQKRKNTIPEADQISFGIDNHKIDTQVFTEQNFESPNTTDKSGGYMIVARGKNEVNATKNATRHAEMVCIDEIVEKFPHNFAKVFENVTVIVNVEPCIMCMAALLDLNVKFIVFTCVNDRFGYNILGDTARTNYIEIVEKIDDVDVEPEEKARKFEKPQEVVEESIEKVEDTETNTEKFVKNISTVENYLGVSKELKCEIYQGVAKELKSENYQEVAQELRCENYQGVTQELRCESYQEVAGGESRSAETEIVESSKNPVSCEKISDESEMETEYNARREKISDKSEMETEYNARREKISDKSEMETEYNARREKISDKSEMETEYNARREKISDKSEMETEYNARRKKISDKSEMETKYNARHEKISDKSEMETADNARREVILSTYHFLDQEGIGKKSSEARNEHKEVVIDSADETFPQSNIGKDTAIEKLNIVQYKLSLMNKHFLIDQDEIILSKISSLVDGYRMCYVFHYRKYESDTMDILKLFYKGVNPNAPKHKVKIKR